MILRYLLIISELLLVTKEFFFFPLFLPQVAELSVASMEELTLKLSVSHEDSIYRL